MRILTAAGVIALALVLFALWLLAPVEPVAATYETSECRRVEVTASDTGLPISGAEDLALMPDGDSLILSAHDRRDPDHPDGGLYRISVWGIDGADRYQAQKVTREGAGETNFRPHGIALSGDGTRLAVINRDAPGQASIEIGNLEGAAWFVTRRLAGQTLCRANDLNFLSADSELLEITLDRQDCGISMSDLLPNSTTGRTALWDGSRLAISRTGLTFPNGIFGPYIAETRKSRVLRPAGEPIRLPGGPDNITAQDRRTLLIAVHPSLRRLWLYLNGVWPSAPSRVVRVNVLSSAVEVLFDDATGSLFSGATSAVFAKDMLIVGSVADDGLLVCQKGRT